MESLKKEINLRYNIMRYKKLQKQYLYNRMEINNVHIITQAIEEMKLENIQNIS